MISDIVKEVRGVSMVSLSALHGRWPEKKRTQAMIRRWSPNGKDGEDAWQEIIAVVVRVKGWEA